MHIPNLIEAAQKFTNEGDATEARTLLKNALQSPGVAFYYHPKEDGTQAKPLDLAKLAVEQLARSIYEGWADQPDYTPWVIGGNSHKQTEARQLARDAVAKP